MTGTRGRVGTPLFPPNDVEMNRSQRNEAAETNMDDDEDDEDDEEVQREEEEAETHDDAYQAAVQKAVRESMRDFEAEIYSRAQRDLLRLPKPGTVPPVSASQAPKQNSQDVSNNNLQEICLGNFVKV